MRRRHGDRGVVETGIAVLIGLIMFGLGMTVVVVQDLSDARNGRWGRTDGHQPGVISLALPFIGPALPTDPDQAACVRQVAQGRGLVWNAQKGWRAPGRYDEPDLSGDPVVALGRLRAWTDQINSYVASVRPDWDPCVAPSTTLPPTPEEVKPLVQGTYRLEVGGGGECAQATPPTGAVITQTGEELRVTLRGGQLSQPLPLVGPIRPDYSFDVVFTGEIFGGPATLRLTGRFDTFQERTLLRDGVMTFTLGSESCQFSMFGERIGPL